MHQKGLQGEIGMTVSLEQLRILGRKHSTSSFSSIECASLHASVRRNGSSIFHPATAGRRSGLWRQMYGVLMLMGRSTHRSQLDQWDTSVSTVLGTGGVGWDVIVDAGPGRRTKSGIESARVTRFVVSYWKLEDRKCIRDVECGVWM